MIANGKNQELVVRLTDAVADPYFEVFVVDLKTGEWSFSEEGRQ